MRRWKRILALVFVLSLISGIITVQAADELVGTTVDGSVLKEVEEVSVDVLPKARGTYLGSGSARLTNKGNHVVNMWGQTSCNRTSDQVKVTLYLQRLSGGTWTTIYTLDTKIAYNDHYVSNSKNVTVTGGYYYRISGTHVAVKGKTTESTYSSTDGMWVSK